MGTSDAIVEVTDASFDEEIEQVDGLHMVGVVSTIFFQ